MTKNQIKQELRRSACEDENPHFDVAWQAYLEAVICSDWPRKPVRFNKSDDHRTFFLLVAEAL